MNQFTCALDATVSGFLKYSRITPLRRAYMVYYYYCFLFLIFTTSREKMSRHPETAVYNRPRPYCQKNSVNHNIMFVLCYLHINPPNIVQFYLIIF